MSNIQNFIRGVRPDPAIITRVAEAQAKKHGTTLSAVLGTKRDPSTVDARRATFVIVMRVTGCSPAGLAEVWGCDRKCVNRAVEALNSPPKPRKQRTPRRIYMGSAAAKLTWQYGPERAATIMSGQDPATNADIAAWRRLCERAA